jgi:hypothetical protein
MKKLDGPLQPPIMSSEDSLWFARVNETTMREVVKRVDERRERGYAARDACKGIIRWNGYYYYRRILGMGRWKGRDRVES